MKIPAHVGFACGQRRMLLLLAIAASNACAQSFVLDPYFGTAGIATYEWSAGYGQHWDSADAWAERSADGKWVVVTQLRDGVNQLSALNWFDANGQITQAGQGAGAYTPVTRSVWNVAGLAISADSSLTIGTSGVISNANVDYIVRRSFPDGSVGYSGCNGTFFQQIAYDLGAPPYDGDAMTALSQDFIGRQVLVGTLATTGGENRIGVARIQPQCGLDSSLNGTGKQVIDPNPFTIFPPPRRARANTVIHDAFGRILIGGGVTFGLNSSDDGACIVVRLLGNGQRDGSFGNNGVAYINSFTNTPGNIRCDVRGLAVQNNGRILVNMDWTLTAAQGTSSREYNQRLTDQGTYDPSWLDPCCTVGYSSVEVKSGGVAILASDAIGLIVSSSFVNQEGIDDATASVIPLRLSDGSYAADFMANGTRPLGFVSTSYHRIVVDSPDSFVVVATSGNDYLNHRRVHLLRYRRASTIPDDTIYRNGFDT